MGFLNAPTPAHYTQDEDISCIDAIEAALTPEEFRGFLRGNVAKYWWRYPMKNGVEDLLKAHWYLNRLIQTLQQEESANNPSRNA